MNYEQEVFIEDPGQKEDADPKTGKWLAVMTCIECGHAKNFLRGEVKDRWDMPCEQCKTGTYTYTCYIDKGGKYFGQKYSKPTRAEFDKLDKAREKDSPELTTRQQRIARILYGRFLAVLTPEQADKELIKLGAKSTWVEKAPITDDTDRTVLQTLGERFGEKV